MNIEHTIREGTSRQSRYLKTLRPDYVSVEERSLEDLLQFAEKFARYLQFYNENNEIEGDWSGIFAAGSKEIAAYFTDPAKFTVDPNAEPDLKIKQHKRLERLTMPHLGLFLAFLKLSQYHREVFNEFTVRHLDFYYKEVLRLKNKPAVADQIHVIFNPGQGITAHPVNKGTIIKAGKDSLFKDISYELKENLIVTPAKVASVKTFRKVQKYISLYDMCRDEENGFKTMFSWALGHRFQGDELPGYPSAQVNDISVDVNALLDLYKNNSIDQDYVLNHLCFLNMEAFNDCFNIYGKSLDPEQNFPSRDEWLRICLHIERAFVIKDRRNRCEELKAEHETNGFEAMMKLAFGKPNPGDDLSQFPSCEDDLSSLYTILSSDNSRDTVDFVLAARYVTDELCLSVPDFKKIMSVKSQQDQSTADWQSVYSIVEEAQRLKTNYKPPSPGRLKTLHLIGSSIAEAKGKSAVSVQRFKTFGKAKQEPDLDLYHSPGIAVSSPLLLLESGIRTIKLSVACDDKGLLTGDIKRIIGSDQPVFDIFLSSKKEWIKIEQENINIQIGDIISGGPVETFKTKEIDLLFEIADAAGRDVKYILFEDGSLWEAESDKSSNIRFKLTYKASLKGKWACVSFSNTELEGNPVILDGLVVIEERSEIQARGALIGGVTWYGGPKKEEKECFFERDAGKFIVWTDGRIYSIDAVMSGGRIKTTLVGKIPDYNTKTPQKYDQICFKGSISLGTFSIAGIAISENSTRHFSDQDIGRLITFENGQAFKIINIEENRKSASVKRVETKTAGSEGILMYESFQGLQFIVNIGYEIPAITCPGPYQSQIIDKNSYPIMKILLKNIPTNIYGEEKIVNAYEYFESVKIKQATLNVSVFDYTDFKMASDTSSIDPKKPFEPFGYAPKPGASLYFAGRELSQKKLDTLDIQINWMGLPQSFKDHYYAYSRCGLANVPEIDEQSFRARLSVLNNGSWIDIEWPKPMFVQNADNSDACCLSFNKGFNRSSYKTLKEISQKESNEPFDFKRYFKLELESPDFQHDIYPLVAAKIAGTSRETARTFTLYPPYNPEIKKIQINYTASSVIKPSIENSSSLDRVFHIHPFGYMDICHTIEQEDPEQSAYLFPLYPEEGALFIGIKQAVPKHQLSILFKMLPGTGQADIKPADVKWQYLDKQKWRDFEEIDILSDSTKGLSDTGIIRLYLPPNSSTENPVMPKGMNWIRAIVTENADAAPDTAGIHTNAALAEFIDNRNAVDRLAKPLNPGAVQAIFPKDPAIESIEQPYPSFRGTIAETSHKFYTRVSELLRHKGRAVTPWDIERLILEKFPEVCQVKCLNSSEQQEGVEPARVTVIIVPDISNSEPFFPLEPKAPASLLKSIKDYLTTASSSFADIQVKNPFYEQIIFRVAVRFKEGFGQGYYQQQLSSDIKKYLSPWAYNQSGVEINSGRILYISSLILFIEKLAYIDYVANAKLFERETLSYEQESGAAKWRHNKTGIAKVKQPDQIIVSFPVHHVDVIKTEEYREEDFIGVGYMIIGLDFFVK